MYGLSGPIEYDLYGIILSSFATMVNESSWNGVKRNVDIAMEN